MFDAVALNVHELNDTAPVVLVRRGHGRISGVKHAQVAQRRACALYLYDGAKVASVALNRYELNNSSPAVFVQRGHGDIRDVKRG